MLGTPFLAKIRKVTPWLPLGDRGRPVIPSGNLDEEAQGPALGELGIVASRDHSEQYPGMENRVLYPDLQKEVHSVPPAMPAFGHEIPLVEKSGSLDSAT
jgi:hypothetical protein